MRRAVALFFLLFLFAASPSGAGEVAHPLEGKIYLPGEGRFVPEDEILRRMLRADIVYLGERHDNPGHHRLQTRLLKALIRSGKRPAAAFEMFTRDMAEKLAAHLASPEADLAMIPGIVGWKKRGWPAWEMYAPIVEAAYLAPGRDERAFGAARGHAGAARPRPALAGPPRPGDGGSVHLSLRDGSAR